VRQEWQYALQADKAVTPILRQGDYPLDPDELKQSPRWASASGKQIDLIALDDR
jgi:hypothetical protein